MLSKELTSDDWTKIARGEWKPKPYDLRMAGFDALKLLKRAESAEAELLSLREQMAELKALPPFSWGLADKDGNAYLSECCIGDEGCMIDEAEAYNYELEPEHHIHAVPLFTASKPAED
ncbi:TPA: hypothetical protein ACVBGZ_002003 [Yersinia enterocolitica]